MGCMVGGVPPYGHSPEHRCNVHAVAIRSNEAEETRNFLATVSAIPLHDGPEAANKRLIEDLERWGSQPAQQAFSLSSSQQRRTDGVAPTVKSELFTFNCDSGLTMTKAPERRNANEQNTRGICICR